MKSFYYHAALVSLGLVTGTCIYGLFTDTTWPTVLERCFFQAVSVFTFAAVLSQNSKVETKEVIKIPAKKDKFMFMP